MVMNFVLTRPRTRISEARRAWREFTDLLVTAFGDQYLSSAHIRLECRAGLVAAEGDVRV